MASTKKYSIGIDLGATKTAIAIVRSDGELISHQLVPTEKKPNALIQQLTALISSILETAEGKNIQGIGLAAAGPLNVETGNLIHPSNFPDLKVFPIVARLKTNLKKSKINLPLFFQNDAMAAALGEGWIGGAQMLSTYAVITVGTGIGTGIIFQNKPLQHNGMGGEFGIQLIDFKSLRKRGLANPTRQSVEGIASGTAICKRARRKGFTGDSIQELLIEMEAEGPDKYKPLFEDAAAALAMLCYNLSLGFHPEKILFAGGVMHARKHFLPELRLFYKELTNSNLAFRTPIAMAKLSYKAGAIGAARLPFIENYKD